MGIKNMIQTMKLVHKLDIVLVKIGNFYQVYGKDAYIISYLFGYKLKKIENTRMCGFPLSSVNRMIATLENKKINCLIIDRRNNYEVEERADNKNLNNYTKCFEKAKKYISDKTKIDNVNNFLLKNINQEDFKDIIRKMEDEINERGKISSY